MSDLPLILKASVGTILLACAILILLAAPAVILSQ